MEIYWLLRVPGTTSETLIVGTTPEFEESQLSSVTRRRGFQ